MVPSSIRQFAASVICQPKKVCPSNRRTQPCWHSSGDRRAASNASAVSSKVGGIAGGGSAAGAAVAAAGVLAVAFPASVGAVDSAAGVGSDEEGLPQPTMQARASKPIVKDRAWAVSKQEASMERTLSENSG